MPAINCKLVVAGFLHMQPAKRHYVLPQRILAGETVLVDASQNSVGRYQYVLVKKGTKLEDKEVVQNDVFGYMAIAKLLPEREFIEDFLALQNVGVNGVTALPADFGRDSYYQRMLVDASHLCAVTALIVATQADRQAALQGMRAKINKLSWLQIAAGTAGLTIAVAGSVASMGTLAPVFLLLGYGISATAGGAGLGASLISARIDEVHTTLEVSAGGIVAKQGTKGAAAVAGKQAAVRSAGALGGAGAASVASSALGAVGGAFGIASGAARLANSGSRSNRIGASEALGALPWQLVSRELTRVLAEIRADKRIAGDAMAGEFDRTIQTLEATIALLRPLADA